ncbi:protein of unknown function [Paraburkholderia dioscoreae]|uniref:Uncharacterized protein n=1 Tax=Paraburkholderia dioscoreae TaxID=2604047 RepID=A0A5Q4ZIX6_9BURK|nr:protein of unknown function [Paraburkholderia dioscoreae]
MLMLTAANSAPSPTLETIFMTGSYGAVKNDPGILVFISISSKAIEGNAPFRPVNQTEPDALRLRAPTAC